jgi:hypothetical protein
MTDPSKPPADRTLIAALADDIAEARGLRRVAAYFAENGAPAPRVTWNPAEGDLPAGPLQFLARYWRDHCVGGALPPLGIVDPLALKPALGYLMLLDVLDGGWDYRYRIYGSEIASRFGRDLTGRCTSDIVKTAYTGIFYIAGYRAVLARREPLFAISSSPSYVAAVDWWRLSLPLVDRAGAITRILVGNMPGDWRAPTAPLPPRPA